MTDRGRLATLRTSLEWPSRVSTESLSFTFSVTEAKPLVGCCVRISKTWNLPSRDVATNLFILMSFLSNSKLHTWKQRIYLLLLLIDSYILYLLKTGYGCFACFHICTPGVCLVPREARREGQNPLELELQAFLGHHVCAGNQILILWKSIQCALLLSYFSRSCSLLSYLNGFKWCLNIH